MPGYAALKLAAWRDRSEVGRYKDATDLAAVLFWYTSSAAITDRLYAEEHGQELLLAYQLDQDLAAAHLLGEDIAETVGPERRDELFARWPGPRPGELLRNMDIAGNPPTWTRDPARRRQLLDALESGWFPLQPPQIE